MFSPFTLETSCSRQYTHCTLIDPFIKPNTKTFLNAIISTLVLQAKLGTTCNDTSLAFQYSQLSLLGLLLYYLMLISLSSQSENQTAGERVVVGFTFMFVEPYQPTFVVVPVQQVFVSCNFCGKSISYSCSAMPHQGRGFSQYGVSGSPTKSKVTSCPGCRKPLPRCALCLMNMGTPVNNCPGKLVCVEYVDRC